MNKWQLKYIRYILLLNCLLKNQIKDLISFVFPINEFWDWTLKYLLKLIPSPTGRWSALYTTESQQHCTLLGLLCGIPSSNLTSWSFWWVQQALEMWASDHHKSILAHSSSLPVGWLNSLLSSCTVQSEKSWQKFQQADAGPWHFFRLSVFREDQSPDISRSSPVIWVTLLSDQPRS